MCLATQNAGLFIGSSHLSSLATHLHQMVLMSKSIHRLLDAGTHTHKITIYFHLIHNVYAKKTISICIRSKAESSSSASERFSKSTYLSDSRRTRRSLPVVILTFPVFRIAMLPPAIKPCRYIPWIEHGSVLRNVAGKTSIKQSITMKHLTT